MSSVKCDIKRKQENHPLDAVYRYDLLLDYSHKEIPGDVYEKICFPKNRFKKCFLGGKKKQAQQRHYRYRYINIKYYWNMAQGIIIDIHLNVKRYKDKKIKSLELDFPGLAVQCAGKQIIENGFFIEENSIISASDLFLNRKTKMTGLPGMW